MKKILITLAAVLTALALTTGGALASIYVSSTAPPTHIAVKAAGTSGKTLNLRQQRNPDRVQLIITNEVGEREAVILQWGDLNGAIAVLRHDPAQG